MAVGADQVGQHPGIPTVRLGPRDGVALPIAAGRQRVHRHHLVAGRDQRPDQCSSGAQHVIPPAVCLLALGTGQQPRVGPDGPKDTSRAFRPPRSPPAGRRRERPDRQPLSNRRQPPQPKFACLGWAHLPGYSRGIGQTVNKGTVTTMAAATPTIVLSTAPGPTPPASTPSSAPCRPKDSAPSGSPT